MKEPLVSLERLFAPASIAVIGATSNPGKWGHQYAKSLLAAEHRRQIYLVNERGENVLDRPTFRTIAELPEAPDVAVLCVPAARVEEVTAAAVARGAKFVICITAGFSETGEDGRKAQESLVKLVRDAGARLVGPNCFGVYDAAAELACIAYWAKFHPGSVGVVSQSGGVLIELAARLADHGHGLSRAVSVGNQADLTIADYLSPFADHPETRAVVAYIEDFRDGRALLSAVDQIVAKGKPVVLLVPGGNEAVKRAASSHTGALVSNDAMIEAACADSGVLRVRSLADAILALRGMLSPHRAAGRRVAVIGDVGGATVLGADAVVAAALMVPNLTTAVQEAIRPQLGAGSGISNPIDAVGVYNLEDILPAVETVAASGEVDSIFVTGVLNNLQPSATKNEEQVGKRLVDIGRRYSLQLVISSSLPDEPALWAIAREGIPVFLYAKDAAQCLSLSTQTAPRRKVPAIESVLRKLPSLASDYFAARVLFAEYGVNLSTARAVRTKQEALAAAREIGYPVALKGLGSIHKSDVGAVALNLRSEVELAARFEEMEKRLAPPEFSVEQMVDSKNAVEILVGALRDRSFGPTVAVGIGGIFAEIVRDTVVALAPVTEAYARDMLLQLKGAAILQGFRGRPSPDLDALARNVAAVSRLIAECPEISEAELNPVLAMPTGVVAVDARIALVS